MATRLEYSVTAKCKPEHVWQKFQKLEEWPWWNRVVGQARWISGPPWQKDSQFFMELVYPRKVSFKPIILESAPPNKIGWLGRAPGFTGEHWFTFETQNDGVTLIKTWEDISGWASTFLGHGMKQTLLAMHQSWLEALKTEAEKIAREEYAKS
jgi:hypothetical protein